MRDWDFATVHLDVGKTGVQLQVSIKCDPYHPSSVLLSLFDKLHRGDEVVMEGLVMPRPSSREPQSATSASHDHERHAL
jgi:hypothetical protein